ncbi:hypothetical protein [Enterovirga aerilata]|uniref:Uncharacterized protein n=1 Tax=Enterovirga aerilata TaxID=2730920 RepID=A0A849IG66_9HYPH|nr:hypothetical protein [Enterovirga sp. DB1703]NNM72913.1 hypothetical protein [Enterovirga sp. DB1703]
MRLARAILASNKGRIVLALLAGYLGWQGWLTLAAPGKVAPELKAGQPRVNVMVTLPFPPERFHVLEMQRFGRVSGTEDNSVEVRGVRQDDLNAIARPYWVRRVGPMEEGG